MNTRRKPNSAGAASAVSVSAPYFLSLRWRLLLPVYILLVSLAAWGGYALSINGLGARAGLTPTAQQIAAVLAATGGAAVVVCVFLLGAVITRRINRVSYVARELTTGNRTARTSMTPRDEIGKLGHALDQYADYAQQKQDELRSALRRKRREVSHLISALEAIPDGVILQDNDGRVILMNDQARRLLGSQRVFRSSGLHELTALVTDKLGPALAPGLYALGDPQRVDLDGMILSAQAAAVTSMSDYRLGTVILLRDISDLVRQEQARRLLLERLENEIHQPLAEIASRGGGSADMRAVARHAGALQKVIVELREVDTVDAAMVQREQKPMLLETLVYAVVNEWRQIAQASKLELQVMIEQRGMYVLGDERRLRWALGNLVDNAIKYTLPGGVVTLEVKGESTNKAILRVRDNGVGINPDDFPHIFTRFFRGTPTNPDGRAIHVPGMGQGLYVAQQIIEAHGGQIKLKTKVGVGTAAYIALPLTAAEGLLLPTRATTIEMDEDLDGETIPYSRDRDSRETRRLSDTL